MKHTQSPWSLVDNSIVGPKMDDKDVWLRPVVARFSTGIKEGDAALMVNAPEMFGCVLSMLRWYSNRLDGHNVSPYENQPPEIQRAMRVYQSITGEEYK